MATTAGRRTVTEQQYGARPPARRARGQAYWLLVGWWWEPLCWAARMALWSIPPLGAWRSSRKGRKNREARERRGYR